MPVNEKRFEFGKTKLTAIVLPTKNRDTYYDVRVPKLALRVTPAGAKTFYVVKRAGSDMVWLKLGSFPDMTVENARKDAEAKLGEFASDVRADVVRKTVRAKEKAASESANFGAAWNDYVARKSPKWGAAHIRGHKQAIEAQNGEAPLAEFLDLKLTDVTPERVRKWVEKNSKDRPTFTNAAFRKLRAFLNWCAEDEDSDYHELVNVESCGKRIAKEIPKSKPKTGSLQREQLKSWFVEVRKLTNPIVSSYLQILLLTGARREELATLTWENLDLKWGAMTIKDKIDGERTIPVTPYMSALLHDLKAINETPPPEYRILHGKRIKNDLENWKPSKWVFFSKIADDGRMVEPRKGHDRALKAAGLPALTLHDLRRSFSNMAEWVETPTGISAQIMGHKPSATAEKHYKQRPLDLLRMWHTKIEGWILEQAGIDQIKGTPKRKELTSA